MLEVIIALVHQIFKLTKIWKNLHIRSWNDMASYEKGEFNSSFDYLWFQ